MVKFVFSTSTWRCCELGVWKDGCSCL